MILYTSMPHELIFPMEADSLNKQKIITLNAVPVLVEETPDNQYRIVKVMSTDPSVFLDNQYTPGTMVQMTPQFKSS